MRLGDKAENLSGRVGHGEGYPARVSRYGPTPQRCLLMDGVFLAVRRRVLRQRGLRFDERFHFHFYDLEFCRRAEQLGVSMGTWPISAIHQSGGDFGSARWRSVLAAYFQKWRESATALQRNQTPRSCAPVGDWPHPCPAPNSPMRIAFSSSSTRMSPTAASAATPMSGQSIGLVS